MWNEYFPLWNRSIYFMFLSVCEYNRCFMKNNSHGCFFTHLLYKIWRLLLSEYFIDYQSKKCTEFCEAAAEQNSMTFCCGIQRYDHDTSSLPNHIRMQIFSLFLFLFDLIDWLMLYGKGNVTSVPSFIRIDSIEVAEKALIRFEPNIFNWNKMNVV